VRDGIPGITELVKEAVSTLAREHVRQTSDPAAGWGHFAISLGDEGGAALPAPKDPNLSYDFLRRSGEEAATVAQERLRQGDLESAELLMRVQHVWFHLAECLQRSNNAHTEKELGRLFLDNCVVLVNFCIREARNPAVSSKRAGLDADFKTLRCACLVAFMREGEAVQCLEAVLHLRHRRRFVPVSSPVTSHLTCPLTSHCIRHDVGAPMSQALRAPKPQHHAPHPITNTPHGLQPTRHVVLQRRDAQAAAAHGGSAEGAACDPKG
jgi:hypothetical protein